MILETCYILIWSSGIVCLLTILYSVMREYAFVTVNCWFCNTNFRIPFKSRKEWFCIQCHQFNGFKADGDYSRILPEQFDEALNQKFVGPALRKNEYVFSSNGLCSICNANQELKIKQLALYVPFQEKNYDEEIEIFRNKLEKSYKLCEKCENFVNNKLQPKSNSEHLTSGPKIDKIIAHRCSTASKYGMISKVPAILFVVVGTSVACIFKTKLFEKSFADLLTNCGIEQVFQQVASQFYGDLALNYIFAISTAFLPCILLKRWMSAIGILLVIFSSMICEDLIPFWKVFAVSTVVIALVIRYIANKTSKQQRELQKLDFNLQNRFDLEFKKDEEDVLQKKLSTRKLNLSTCLNGNAPLCGQFSDMHLGKCEKYVSHLPRQSSPLSFKCDRLLIQPPKLKIDDFDHTDTLRTSPTVSSGYQSLCGGFFKKTSDSDSEFDSISQVHIAAANHSFNISKTTSPSSRFTQQPRFRPTDALNLSATECYYGAIPIYSPTSTSLSSSQSLNFSNEKSQLQVDVSTSTFQIVLYSITCFVLGFSFQICVREFFI